MNDFRDQRKRVLSVKFLGEMYNYRLVDSATVFFILYTFLTLGHGMLPPTVFVPCVDVHCLQIRRERRRCVPIHPLIPSVSDWCVPLRIVRVQL